MNRCVCSAIANRSLLVLIEVYSISQVRVSFEKAYLLNFVRVGTGVTQDEQSVADVNHVDQPVPDDGIAPHDDLRLEVGIAGIRVQQLGHCRCRTCAQGWILGGDHWDWRWTKHAGLGRIGRIRDIDRLHSVGMPVNKSDILKHGGVMRREAPELLRHGRISSAAAEGKLVLVEQKLARDERVRLIRYVD